MNLRKLLILTSMSLAAIAFAVPASASADIFTHQGEPAEGQPHFTLSGTFGWTFTADSSRGVHCTTVDFTTEVTVFGAHPISLTFAGCTTTSPVGGENGLPVDSISIDLTESIVDPDAANSRLLATNTHINNKVTHPITTHLILAESTLKGTISATITGSTTSITTLDLGDEGATVQSGLPPAGTGSEVSVTGHLTSNGTIGIE